jgi:hypothetical protein
MRYSRSKISRASRNGIAMNFSPPAPFGEPGTRDPTSCGNMSALMAALGSPPQRIIKRSTLLRSSRTLPGHSCDCRMASASLVMPRLGKPPAEEICSMKNSMRSGMSSRRSEREGMRKGTTDSR